MHAYIAPIYHDYMIYFFFLNDPPTPDFSPLPHPAALPTPAKGGPRTRPSGAPPQRKSSHTPPMPWVSGVIGKTRSVSVISSLPVKASNVTCLSRADSDA